MNRIFQIVLILILFVPLTHAQESHTGYSKPGSIGRKSPKDQIPPGEENRLVCSVSFQDPNEDAVLNEGERIGMDILVRNFLADRTVYPKLEILIRRGPDQRPILKVIWLTRIGPGQMVTFKEHVQWHPELLPGAVSYTFRAFDARLGVTSEPIEIRFDIDNPGGN